MRIGEATLMLKAAKSMLFEQVEHSRQTVVVRGEPMNIAERLDNRLTQAGCIQLAIRGLDELWAATGGAGIQSTETVQRAWRDAHAVAHHVSFNWDAVSSMIGQHRLGLDPQGQY